MRKVSSFSLAHSRNLSASVLHATQSPPWGIQGTVRAFGSLVCGHTHKKEKTKQNKTPVSGKPREFSCRVLSCLVAYNIGRANFSLERTERTEISYSGKKIHTEARYVSLSFLIQVNLEFWDLLKSPIHFFIIHSKSRDVIKLPVVYYAWWRQLARSRGLCGVRVCLRCNRSCCCSFSFVFIINMLYWCIAYDCTNYFRKSDNRSWYRLPLKDEELLKKWLAKIEPTHQSTSTPVYVVMIFILLASSDVLDQLEST